MKWGYIFVIFSISALAAVFSTVAISAPVTIDFETPKPGMPLFVLYELEAPAALGFGGYLADGESFETWTFGETVAEYIFIPEWVLTSAAEFARDEPVTYGDLVSWEFWDQNVAFVRLDGGILPGVPLPAAAWLFGSALVGLVTLCRWKRPALPERL